MTDKIETFDNHVEYRDVVSDITEAIGKLDLNQPAVNVVDENSTTMELLKMQSQIQSQTLGKALEFMRNLLPLREVADDAALFAKMQETK